MKPSILVILTDDVGWGDFFFRAKDRGESPAQETGFRTAMFGKAGSAVSTRRRRAAVWLV